MDTGALKGYVSISLGWNGIDNRTLHQICRSVYDEDELHTLEREARILSGEEHSNMLSMTFTGYEVPLGVSFLNPSMPSLTITPKGFRFNKIAHTRFDYCDYIELLYHPILKSIVIRQCKEPVPNAVRWQNENGKITSNFTSRALAQAIYENMDWKPELSFKFRCVTKERYGSKLFFISLDEPQVLVDKKTKENLGITNSKVTVQYIQHKNTETTKDTDSFSARLQNWNDSRFGFSYALRKRRDQMADQITADDINRSVQIVDNPLIGKIPTREEIAAELDALLMCM